MLDLRSKRLEDYPSVVSKVSNELLLVEETAVTLVQLIGEVPMVEGHQRGNACGMQVVDEFDIMLDTLFIDRIVTASEGDDTRPGYRERTLGGPGQGFDRRISNKEDGFLPGDGEAVSLSTTLL